MRSDCLALSEGWAGLLQECTFWNMQNLKLPLVTVDWCGLMACRRG